MSPDMANHTTVGRVRHCETVIHPRIRGLPPAVADRRLLVDNKAGCHRPPVVAHRFRHVIRCRPTTQGVPSWLATSTRAMERCLASSSASTV